MGSVFHPYSANGADPRRAHGNGYTEFVHGTLDAPRLGQSRLCRHGETVEKDGRKTACGWSGERVQRRGTTPGEWDRGDPAGQVTTAVFFAKVSLGILSFYDVDGLNRVGCRTKDIIKDQLPKKYDEVVFCPLTEIQVEVYKQILGMEAVQNMIKKDERCDCGSGKRYVQ